MFKFNIFYAALIALSLFSCKKNDDTVDFHHEYFPLEEGTFVEYDVTEISHYGTPTKSDTINYRLKTVVGDTVIDNSGRIARKFYRYIFDEITQAYKVKDLWTAIIDQERAELVEENQRLIKLVFAPTSSKEWDMNAFNSYDPAYAYYDVQNKKIHVPNTYGSLSFDSTLTVIEEDSVPTAISFKNKYEVYAKGVGLVKKCYQDLVVNFDITKPISGTEIFYTVTNYGVE